MSEARATMPGVPAPRATVRTLWLAIPVALLAAFFGVLTLGAFVQIPPAWLGFAVHSAVIATVWMLAGGYFAPRTHLAYAVVFVPGALLCAWLALSLASGVSLYSGVPTVLLSCIAGGAVWTWYMRSAPPVRARWALTIPATTAVLVTSAALMRPVVGMRANMWDVTLAPIEAHVTYGAAARSDLPLVWTPAPPPLDSLQVALERDGGSGSQAYDLRRLRSAAEVRNACQAFRESTTRLIANDVANGVIPRFITWLPHRQLGCTSGSFWSATPVSVPAPAFRRLP